MRNSDAPETDTNESADPSSVPIHGVLVRYLRKEREMSMTELAELVGVGHSYINRIEVGISPRVSLGVYRNLRAALGLLAADSRVLMACPFGIPETKPRARAGAAT